MERKPKIHIHPISKKKMYGRKLDFGDLLRKGDKYASETGHWEDIAPEMAEIESYEDDVIFVRPWKNSATP